MKTIPLTRGLVAMVDDEDYGALAKYNWYAVFKEKSGSFYAVRNSLRHEGARRCVSMSEAVLGKCPPGLIIDHANLDTLDNRRENLRYATFSQNIHNRRTKGAAGCGYRGLQLKGGKWHVKITVQKKQIWIGSFRNSKDAARAYDRAARSVYGRHAVLNFPDEISIRHTGEKFFRPRDVGKMRRSPKVGEYPGLGMVGRKWRARITIDKRRVNLGRFKTKAEGVAAIRSAALKAKIQAR